MRSAPWRWIEASRVPSSSMRRRTTSSDWLIAAWRKLERAWRRSGAARCGPPSSLTSKSRIRPRGAQTSTGFSLSISASAWSRCAGSVSVRVTRVALHAQPAIADAGGAQAGADIADHALQPLGEHRRDVDLEQEVGAALQVEAERDGAVRQQARQAVAHGLRTGSWATATRTPNRQTATTTSVRQEGSLSIRAAATSCPAACRGSRRLPSRRAAGAVVVAGGRHRLVSRSATVWRSDLDLHVRRDLDHQRIVALLDPHDLADDAAAR